MGMNLLDAREKSESKIIAPQYLHHFIVRVINRHTRFSLVCWQCFVLTCIPTFTCDPHSENNWLIVFVVKHQLPAKFHTRPNPCKRLLVVLCLTVSNPGVCPYARSRLSCNTSWFLLSFHQMHLHCDILIYAYSRDLIPSSKWAQNTMNRRIKKATRSWMI